MTERRSGEVESAGIALRLRGWRVRRQNGLACPRLLPAGYVGMRAGCGAGLAVAIAAPASSVSNYGMNVSGANEIPGSQTGSQRPQPSGDTLPRPAIVAAGK
jgi:hypothetical protein